MNEALPIPREILEQCVCLNMQRAARAVARRYDAAFCSVGLTSGQFAILAALNRPEPIALTALAATLGLDRTTLSRNLGPLKVRRLIHVASGSDDQRLRAISLTGIGREILAEAIPLWRAAQAASAKALGETPWPDTRAVLDRLSRT